MSDTYEEMVKNGVTIDELIAALYATELPGHAKVEIEHIFNYDSGPKLRLFDTLDVVNGVAVLKIEDAT